MGKRISCLLMTYNCKEHLPRTLRTVLGQTWPEIEIVIADGGSTDGTIDIIRDLEAQLLADTGAVLLSRKDTGRTLRWISEPDGGLYDALNKAVKMATGDYLIVTNDRLVRKDALENLMQAAERGGFVGAHADLVYEDETPEMPFAEISVSGENSSGQTHTAPKRPLRRYWHMGNGHRLWTGWMPGHPALLLKREIYERYGNYRTDYRIAADYEFMVRFLKDKRNRLAYVPEVLVSMYYGGTSTAHFSDYVDSFKEGYRSLRVNGFAAPVALFATGIRTLRVLSQFR